MGILRIEINKRWRCSSAPHFMKISINEIFNCMPVFEVEGKTFLVYKFIFFTYFSLFLMNGKIALFSYHHPSCLSPAEALRIIISSLLIFLFFFLELYKECVGSLEDSFLSYCHHNMFQYYFPFLRLFTKRMKKNSISHVLTGKLSSSYKLQDKHRKKKILSTQVIYYAK